MNSKWCNCINYTNTLTETDDRYLQRLSENIEKIRIVRLIIQFIQI